jgi:hypothetical protein
MAEDLHGPPWGQPADPVSQATSRAWVDTARPFVQRAIAQARAAGVPDLTLHYVLCDETAKVRSEVFGAPGTAVAEELAKALGRRPGRRQEALF